MLRARLGSEVALTASVARILNLGLGHWVPLGGLPVAAAVVTRGLELGAGRPPPCLPGQTLADLDLPAVAPEAQGGPRSPWPAGRLVLLIFAPSTAVSVAPAGLCCCPSLRGAPRETDC